MLNLCKMNVSTVNGMVLNSRLQPRQVVKPVGGKMGIFGTTELSDVGVN